MAALVATVLFCSILRGAAQNGEEQQQKAPLNFGHLIVKIYRVADIRCDVVAPPRQRALPFSAQTCSKHASARVFTSPDWPLTSFV
jgi:predicted component of type VI protein secretion system